MSYLDAYNWIPPIIITIGVVGFGMMAGWMLKGWWISRG